MSVQATLFPLKVETNNTPWPTVRLPESLIEEVGQYLDGQAIWYRLDDHSISLNGRPPMTSIWFKRGADPTPIQESLDRMPHAGVE